MSAKRGISTTAIILIIVAGIMLFTCPKAVQHEDEMSEVLSAVWHDKCNDMTKDASGAASWLGNALGGILGESMIPAIVKSNLEVKDYFLVSLGYWHSGEDRNLITIGAFNHVFCLASKERIASELNMQ
ncbi:MAG: DUF4359 domain-containing protein [Bacteroidales bacterium]|nr:DUF4359 domain-containing protein [Bacteroidales bacterium]